MANVVSLKSGGQIAPIIPQTIEEVFRLAQGIAASGLAPAGMDKPEQVTVAIMTGMEIGLPPMFAVQKIAVINGRPAIWGDAVPALVLSRGFKLREWIEGDGNDRVAHCEVTRPDSQKIERKFSVRDAVTAGLWQTAAKVKRRGKDGSYYEKDNDSPWYRFPERMLQMRARGYACRDGAADVLSGLYLREELDEPMRDITPAKPEPLSIPDIPDEEPDTKSSRAGTISAETAENTSNVPEREQDNEPAELLADPEGFLTKLADDISICDSFEEVAQLVESNAGVIARLPKAHKKRAEAMLKEAAE